MQPVRAFTIDQTFDDICYHKLDPQEDSLRPSSHLSKGSPEGIHSPGISGEIRSSIDVLAHSTIHVGQNIRVGMLVYSETWKAPKYVYEDVFRTTSYTEHDLDLFAI